MHANNETGRRLPDRRAGPHRQGDRPGHRRPHRRHPDGRASCPSTCRGELRHVDLLVVLRPQAPRAQGDRLPVRAPRHAVPAVPARRPPGGRPARRHGERGLHRRPRPGAGAGGRPPTGRTRRASPRCATDWSGSSLHASPSLEVNGAGAPRLGNTSNLSCHFIEGEGILYQLSATGSAPRPARPAPPAPSSRPTCCAAWACRSRPPTARCGSRFSRYNCRGRCRPHRRGLPRDHRLPAPAVALLGQRLRRPATRGRGYAARRPCRPAPLTGLGWEDPCQRRC